MQFGPDSLTKIYAITSGKGGVGKSTLTANLGGRPRRARAAGRARRRRRVRVLDPRAARASPGAKPTQVGDMILPPVAHGVKVISIGMFVEGSTAVSWRGPLLHRTMQQFLTDVYFGDLDVLLLDLPPGTGDVAISLGQLLPQAEVLVVTTPQPAAAEVAERSGLVARQTGQTVIGVVENMAGLCRPTAPCSSCSAPAAGPTWPPGCRLRSAGARAGAIPLSVAAARGRRRRRAGRAVASGRSGGHRDPRARRTPRDAVLGDSRGDNCRYRSVADGSRAGE